VYEGAGPRWLVWAIWYTGCCRCGDTPEGCIAPPVPWMMYVGYCCVDGTAWYAMILGQL
jgi:hypothetical protein